MKKVNFGAKRPSLSGQGTVDDWVGNKEPTKRLTIDVPVSLHKRVKSRCAMDNLVMADVIRELLEQRFPHSPEAEHGVPS
ncbi:hypothetical protein Mal52_37170 [Symmachiella dynata]|uniref:ParG n=1 Tax=Symmachiella dynata TaxID=2527995 RepID=A0A517ZRV9_9PLAN|nr:hypothetical protein [Symmachiella dynata]QDU45226.1 hypothetical protein Mal52_37170 [Symmachiella dynata]